MASYGSATHRLCGLGPGLCLWTWPLVLLVATEQPASQVVCSPLSPGASHMSLLRSPVKGFAEPCSSLRFAEQELCTPTSLRA